MNEWRRVGDITHEFFEKWVLTYHVDIGLYRIMMWLGGDLWCDVEDWINTPDYWMPLPDPPEES